MAYVRSVGRNWWLILLVAALCAGVGGAVAAGADPKYRSQASLAVTTSPSLRGAPEQINALFTIRGALTTTLAEFVRSSSVLDDAASAARLGSAERGTLDVTAQVVPNSVVVLVTVEGTQADPVALAGPAVVGTAKRRFEDVYPVSSVIVVEPASPAEQVGTSTMRAVAVAGALGLGLGFILGLLRDAITSVRWSGRPQG